MTSFNLLLNIVDKTPSVNTVEALKIGINFLKGEIGAGRVNIEDIYSDLDNAAKKSLEFINTNEHGVIMFQCIMSFTKDLKDGNILSELKNFGSMSGSIVDRSKPLICEDNVQPRVVTGHDLETINVTIGDRCKPTRKSNGIRTLSGYSSSVEPILEAKNVVLPVIDVSIGESKDVIKPAIDIPIVESKYVIKPAIDIPIVEPQNIVSSAIDVPIVEQTTRDTIEKELKSEPNSEPLQFSPIPLRKSTSVEKPQIELQQFSPVPLRKSISEKPEQVEPPKQVERPKLIQFILTKDTLCSLEYAKFSKSKLIKEQVETGVKVFNLDMIGVTEPVFNLLLAFFEAGEDDFKICTAIHKIETSTRRDDVMSLAKHLQVEDLVRMLD